MNRRIILVDSVETPDFVGYLCAGIGNELYTVQELQEMDETNLKRALKLGPTDAAILTGPSSFKYLQQFYHFGIRNENFSDCVKLYRLSIEGGAFVKCITDLPSVEERKDYMSSSFTTERVFNFRQGILKTFEESMNFLEHIDSLPLDTPLGFDYEASGFPLDEVFELSGASISTKDYGAFISFTDIRRSSEKSTYELLLQRLADLLVKRQSYIWTFNMQYEFQVSHRMLGGVDLFNLCDASVFNILNGNHLKKFSLKWTANNSLRTSVWDTEFDRLNDLLDAMYFEIVGKLKREQRKVLKVDISNYQFTPEWEEICKRYPKYINEFKQLIKEYWGMPFMNIPSDILGHYCNLDAFYTLQIYLQHKDEYSNVAIETFLDNIRLGARLHSCGMYKDEEFRLRYKEECEKMMAWGITYCATARCKMKMDKHSKKMDNIKKYNPTCKKLMYEGKFFNGDVLLITKHLLSSNIDILDTTEHGINEGQLMMNYGLEFSENFIKAVVESMVEVKFKGKIGADIVKKRKILGIISEKLEKILGIDKLKLGEKQVELEKYIYYEKAYKELLKISQNQLNDINNIPTDKPIRAFGRYMGLLEYSNFVSDNFFKCKSPKENDEIAEDFGNLFKTETAYLAALLESIQQINGNDKFYSNQGITDPSKGFEHFMHEWEGYCKGADMNFTYPEKTFNLAIEYWKDVKNIKMKDIWTNFDGFTAQASFFPVCKKQYELYGLTFSENDTSDSLYFMRKFTINYLLFKKYSKVLSTYIDGMFLKTDVEVIEDPKTKIPIRKALPGEAGAVTKMFARYEVNTKSSKRWSSGYHTIVSKSDQQRSLY